MRPGGFSSEFERLQHRAVSLKKNDRDTAEILRAVRHSGSPDQAGILSPLSEAEATSGFFTGRPRLNEFLSVMKLTWKLARRDKK